MNSPFDKERKVQISSTREFVLDLDDDQKSTLSAGRNRNDPEADEDNISDSGHKRRRHSRVQNSRLKLWRRRLFAMTWIFLLLSYRRLATTILAIIFPVFVLVIFVISITYHFHWEFSGKAKLELTKDAQESSYTHGTDTTRLRKYFVDNEFLCHKHGGEQAGESWIFFAPKNEFTVGFMERVEKNLEITNHGYGVDTETEVVQLCKAFFHNRTRNPSGSEPAPIGIIFKLKNEISNGSAGPWRSEDYFSTPFSYTIRTFLQEVADTKELFPYYKSLKKEQNLSPYVGSGFQGLQNAIDFAYMQMIAKTQEMVLHPEAQRTKDTVDQTLKKFKYSMLPFPIYLDIKSKTSTWFLLVLALVTGDFFTTFMRSKKIIEERQSGILEMLKLHGLSTSVNWVSVLMQDFVSRGIQSGLLALVLISSVTNVAFLQYDNGFIWFVLYLHGFALASFVHVTSLLFSGATFGAIVSCFIGLLTFIVPMTIYGLGFNLGKFFNGTLCFLFPNWCLANAIYNFLKFESYDTGVNLSVFARFADERRVILPESVCIVVFVVSAITYYLLTVYIDNVQKKRFIPREPYFYWLKRDGQEGEEDNDDEDIIEAELTDEDFDKPPVYESVTSGTVSIKCRKVSQVYGDMLHVLDTINLNIYEGEVTLLLGDTGSGKSELLSCLSGLMKPSSGYTLFYGRPIAGDFALIQDHFGFCFKPHLFYPHLTVAEHIQLCCLLHGNEYMVTKRQCVALLLRLGLYQMRSSTVKRLTEAQKRRLAIAMALANNPKVLILDLPTVGLDSSEVHGIWETLRGLREGRAIIVTATAHAMEEGDLYADRLGIMANGRLLSFSSSSYLKSTLEIGSYIQCDKSEDKEIDVDAILTTIQRAMGPKSDNTTGVSHVQIKAFEHLKTQAYFSIPPKTQLSRVLRALEDHSTELGFTKVSVMHLTLAAVLRDLSYKAGMEQAMIGAFGSHKTTDQYEEVKAPVEIPKLPKGAVKDPNVLSTTIALIIKNVLYVRQKYRFYWMEYLFPLCLTFIFVFLSEFYIWTQPTENALHLSANTYSLSNIPVYLEDVQTLKKGLPGLIADRADRLVLFGDAGKHDQPNFEKALEPLESSMVDYRAQVVIALSSAKDLTAYYASNALHSAPCAHNFLTNLILYSFTDDVRKETNPYRVDVYNHPFNEYETQAIGTRSDITNAAVGCLLSIVVSLMAASKVALPLVDRVTGCRRVQKVAGVRPWQYVGALASCDAIFNFTAAILLMGVVCLADMASKSAFRGFESKKMLFAIFCAHLCWASLPYGYILSKMVSTQLSAYGLYFICHVMLGILPQLLTSTLFNETPYGTRLVLEGILAFSPPYTLTGALIRYIHVVVGQSYCLEMPPDTQKLCVVYDKLINQTTILDSISSDPYFKVCCQKFCTAAGSCYKKPPFFVPKFEIPINIMSCLYIMLLQGLFFLLVLLAVDYNFLQRFWDILQVNILGDVEAARLHLFREVKASSINEESVHEEIERIEAIAETGENPAEVPDIFYTRNITKWFGKKQVVQNIYFGLPRGHILAIMGVNNSGKTTLIRIIVGDLRPELGYCVIEPGLRINKHQDTYLSKIGYLSENDAVLPYLTGFQMMQLIARIKGIPANCLNIHCRKILELFRFSDKEMTTLTAKYERGMKRRLCCAMALIGNCELLILDEPTTGLDMTSQLNFWGTVQLLRLTGQSIIFTSITAQECVENSTKMFIMEDGKMKAIGTPAAINQQYATGWTLIVRFLKNTYSKRELDIQVETLKDYIEEMFSPCELKDKDLEGHLLIYHILGKMTPLSELYSIMETIASDMSDFVSDYLIEESSLDDIMGYFGGSSSQGMKLPDYSPTSDEGRLPGSDDNLDSVELSQENQTKWNALKKRQFLSIQSIVPGSFAAGLTKKEDLATLVRRYQLVKKPVEAILKKRLNRSPAAAINEAAKRPTLKQGPKKMARKENIFKFLAQRTNDQQTSPYTSRARFDM